MEDPQVDEENFEPMILRYFDLSEFDSPDQPGSGEEMKQMFLKLLDEARALAGIPFKINSGFRTFEHNHKIEGKPDSSHLKGYAADIAVNSSRERSIIVRALIKAGFNRIGIADSFIHVDNDPHKTPHLIWIY